MRGQPLNNDAVEHPVLAELPVFTPDPDLWPRIAAAHAKAQAWRRTWRWPAAATAAAAVIAAILIAVPHAPADRGLAEGQRESQTLEREWQSIAPTAARPAADLARLHVIDSALQAAYDRGARPDELQPLWKQRNEALRGLILSARAEAVTRI